MEIYIQVNIATDQLELWFREIRGRDRLLARPMKLEFVTKEEMGFGEGDPIPPSLVIDRLYGTDFLTALTDALENKGIKTESQSYLEGKCEVQEKYIKTLENLLGLNHEDVKNIINIERKG